MDLKTCLARERKLEVGHERNLSRAFTLTDEEGSPVKPGCREADGKVGAQSRTFAVETDEDRRPLVAWVFARNIEIIPIDHQNPVRMDGSEDGWQRRDRPPRFTLDQASVAVSAYVGDREERSRRASQTHGVNGEPIDFLDRDIERAALELRDRTAPGLDLAALTFAADIHGNIGAGCDLESCFGQDCIEETYDRGFSTGTGHANDGQRALLNRFFSPIGK